MKEPGLLADTFARAVSLDRVLDFLLEDPTGAAQFTERIEVAEHSHVRVGRVMRVLVPSRIAIRALGSAHERDPSLPHDDFRIPALCCDADIQASGCLRRGQGLSKERIPPVWSRRRKDLSQ